MEHYAGIDVSLKDSSVCVVDATGRIVREAKVASEPEALIAWFRGLGLEVTRIGLGSRHCRERSFVAVAARWPWRGGLRGRAAGSEHCSDRHVKAALSAMTVKTDRKDARGIAPLLRMGWFRPVHRKSPDAQEVRALLVGRKLLQTKLRDVELSIRGILRGFGLQVGEVSKGKFAARIRELAAGHEMLETVTGAMLTAREGLLAAFMRLHRRMLAIVRADAVCRRLMTVPGVGALVSITFKTAVDDPGRFRSSKAVGAHFGLTPKRYQSGETDVTGGISKCGDAMVRTALYGPRHCLGRQRGAEPADTFLRAQALGDGRRQAPRPEAGEGGAGTQAGRRPASDVGGRHRVPLGQGDGDSRIAA
jgi:transposase